MRPCPFFSAVCLMAWHVWPFDGITARDTPAGRTGRLFSCPMMMCTLPCYCDSNLIKHALNADAADSRSVMRNNIRSSFWGYQSK
ncbi:hypothetical protein KVT40_008380 [Elsinoe batatas]|uniref:Secreted protein n=1 Tax=Elsinoe batatas TaxID=2601811 RepID=A0A8K0KT71_9PEZI|nr:hypothetical protein KVT40_008380 [Elsinoe batatas]